MLDSHRGLDFIELLFFSETMKTIRFAGELLPSWAQMLDVASRLCPVSEASRRWFSRFTGSDGVEDARTVLAHCETLLNALHQHRDTVLKALEREGSDAQPLRIFGGWVYTLETMIQEARSRETCSWWFDDATPGNEDDFGDDGEITLRRV